MKSDLYFKTVLVTYSRLSLKVVKLKQEKVQQNVALNLSQWFSGSGKFPDSIHRGLPVNLSVVFFPIMSVNHV